MNIIDHTGHYAVSLSDPTTGPRYTLSIVVVETLKLTSALLTAGLLTCMVLECGVQECHPLNLSDLKVRLNCKLQLLAHENNNQKLNWRKVSCDGSIGNSRIKYPPSYLQFLSIPS